MSDTTMTKQILLTRRSPAYWRCSVFALFHLPLDPRVRNQQEERDEYIESASDPRVHECERDGDEVENRRNRAAASFTGQPMADLKFQ